MGKLEYYLCKTFHKLPHEIGKARKINPDSIRFLEIAMLQEAEEIEKRRKEEERKTRLKRPRRY